MSFRKILKFLSPIRNISSTGSEEKWYILILIFRLIIFHLIPNLCDCQNSLFLTTLNACHCSSCIALLFHLTYSVSTITGLKVKTRLLKTLSTKCSLRHTIELWYVYWLQFNVFWTVVVVKKKKVGVQQMYTHWGRMLF